MIRLSVSIDDVAAVRGTRGGKEPDPVTAAVLAETAGADGIICHLREDKKYIKERDLFILKEVIKSHFNIKIAPIEEMLKIAMKVAPDMITFVPETKDDKPSEDGLNVGMYFDRIADFTERLHANNIIVSYYIDPEIELLKNSTKAGADYIEMNTKKYVSAKDSDEEEAELHKIISIAQAGNKLGLGIGAGGGLNYYNVVDIAKIEQVEELNIGHSIISRGLMVGVDRAVKDMLHLIR